MKTIGLILARQGSKGLPNKHTKLLNGKPLIRYIIETAKNSSLDDIYVSSDSGEILRLCDDVNVIIRPAELAQDDTPSIDVVKHALKQIGDTQYVALLNACCPFTRAVDVDNCIKTAMETGCSVVSLVEDFSCHPSKVCVLEENNKIQAITDYAYTAGFETYERQKLVKTYKRNAAIYLTKREVVESGTFFGRYPRGYVMPPERSIDIHTQFDFDIAEFLMSRQCANSN